MTRNEKFNDYEGFVEKFKPKKTTDDCYTPPAVYEAVKAWACRRYGIDPGKTVRPFWPGGDYESFDYPAGAVVLDIICSPISMSILSSQNFRTVEQLTTHAGVDLLIA